MALAADDEAAKRAIWDRQRYVIGAETQRKYAELRVLIAGLDGPGCEVAKNVILTGVKQVTLIDDSPVEWSDLTTIFYAGEADIGAPTARVLEKRLAELNRFATVTSAPAGPNNMPTDEQLLAHDVVVYCNKCSTLLTRENELCRKHGVKFIACETRGVVAGCFVDCGDAFVVNDKNGEETVSCIITAIDLQNNVIMVHEDKKHDTSAGDMVYFTGLEGPTMLNSANTQSPVLFEVTDVVGPFAFKIKPPPGFAEALPVVGRCGYVHTTKQPETVAFKSLSDSLASPEFPMTDDVEPKLFEYGHVLTTLRALHAVLGAPYAAVNRATGSLDVDALVTAARAIDADVNEPLVRLLGPSLIGQLNPVACFLGGFAAQQALTAGSGKFSPLKQWMAFDWRELIQALPAGTSGRWPSQQSRYEAQIAVLGEQVHAKLLSSSAFIVGAGALGCEHIKNVAMMGIGCGASSRVTVTDMDTIELSNLSRQFLFRNHHVGHHKSKCAAAAAIAMNPALNVRCEIEKVARDTEAIFSEDFWAQQSLVLNALDNVIARRYVDEKCVEFQRPLFESGTLGTKCNAQTVIPFLTENYGNTHDPPETSIPLCTLKNTPYQIEHTIQWAHDAFHGLFATGPAEVNSYIADPAAFVTSLARDPSNKPTALRTVVDGIANRPRTAEQCVEWARRKFEDQFNILIKQLLHNMPADFVTPNGQPFWSGVRRPPTPVEFDPANEMHMSYVTSASGIIARVYGMSADFQKLTQDDIRRVCAATTVPVFVPRRVEFATDDKGASKQQDVAALGEISEADLPQESIYAGLKVWPEEFEKDADANGHIDFITATSNLRATAYNIPVADRTRTKMIAGKIIPAMITTTALITGIVGIEVLKYVAGANQLAMYRNVFVNIALPLFTFGEPAPPPRSVTYVGNDGKKRVFSMWDRIEIGDGNGDTTVGDAIKTIEERYGVDICMMATPAGLMVYNGLMPNPTVLKATLRARLEQVMKRPIDASMKSVTLILNASANDKDVDLPPARFRIAMN